MFYHDIYVDLVLKESIEGTIDEVSFEVAISTASLNIDALNNEKSVQIRQSY